METVSLAALEGMKPKKKLTHDDIAVRLTLLVGACRQSRVTKKQIEESIERLIKDIA